MSSADTSSLHVQIMQGNWRNLWDWWLIYFPTQLGTLHRHPSSALIPVPNPFSESSPGFLAHKLAWNLDPKGCFKQKREAYEMSSDLVESIFMLHSLVSSWRFIVHESIKLYLLTCKWVLPWDQVPTALTPSPHQLPQLFLKLQVASRSLTGFFLSWCRSVRSGELVSYIHLHRWSPHQVPTNNNSPSFFLRVNESNWRHRGSAFSLWRRRGFPNQTPLWVWEQAFYHNLNSPNNM